MGYIEDGITHEKENVSDLLPTVFLIGDSIRLGYCETVKSELCDIANVVFPKENCQFTQHVLVCLEDWAAICDTDKVALVQFNCGHWDVAHWFGEEESLNSVEVYVANLKRIIKKIKRTFPNAKIVFATTSTMNPNGSIGRNPRTNEEICRYNEAAVAACKDEAYINDIYAITKEYGSEMYADYCHLTTEGFKLLGKEVAKFIRNLI